MIFLVFYLIVKVKLGSTFSESQQEQVVPQGRILSATLFGLKINSITKTLKPGIDCSLYADEFLERLNINLQNIIKNFVEDFPPWINRCKHTV